MAERRDVASVVLRKKTSATSQFPVPTMRILLSELQLDSECFFLPSLRKLKMISFDNDVFLDLKAHMKVYVEGYEIYDL